MKITVTESSFIEAFRSYGRMDNFSVEGLRALFDYLEEMEAGGKEMELDVVAICCDFSEFPSALEAAKEYGFEPDADDDADAQERAALEYLRDQTTVLELSNGVIVQGF